MDILGWLRWQWRKWETWQKFWIVGFFFFGAGVSASEEYKPYVFAIPVSIFFFYTGKWWVWEPIKESYENYQKERQGLFDTIKNSHEK